MEIVSEGFTFPIPQINKRSSCTKKQSLIPLKKAKTRVTLAAEESKGFDTQEPVAEGDQLQIETFLLENDLLKQEAKVLREELQILKEGLRNQETQILSTLVEVID